MKALEIKSTFLVFIVCSISVFIITFYSKGEGGIPLYSDLAFYNNILVEVHGMLIEIMIVGLIVLIFISIGEKRQEVKSLRKEIDYLRLLKSDEVKFKIKGLIDQLNHLKVHDLKLQQCTLSKIQLLRVVLDHSRLHATDFYNSNLSNASLKHVKGEKSVFKSAKLTGVDFRNCEFIRAKFEGSDSRSCRFTNGTLDKCLLDESDLSNSDFRNTRLSGSSFKNCKLRSCDFRGADLAGVIFDGADVQSANFADAKNLTIKQILSCSNIAKAHLPTHILSLLN